MIRKQYVLIGNRRIDECEKENMVFCYNEKCWKQ